MIRIPFLCSAVLAVVLAAGPSFADEAGPPAPASERPPDQPNHAAVEQPRQPAAPQTKPNNPPKPPGGAPSESRAGAIGTPILSLKLALLADPRVSPYVIDIEQGDQTVRLIGKVATEAEKEAAAAVASGALPVAAVINKLEIAPDLGQAILRKQDETITSYVKERFQQSPALKNAGFRVRTENGIVILSGAIRSIGLVFEAAEASKSIPGVKALRTNELKIESLDDGVRNSPPNTATQ